MLSQRRAGLAADLGVPAAGRAEYRGLNHYLYYCGYLWYNIAITAYCNYSIIYPLRPLC